MHAKGLIILLITITVITAVVFAWYNIQIENEVPKMNVIHEDKPEGLGASIYETASNPVSGVAETNAMVGAGDNPFDEYKNPFDE